MKFKKRKIIYFIISLPLIFFIAYFCIFMFVDPWSEISCYHEYIDINTGRIRITRYLFYRKTSEKVEESLLSETIGPFLEEKEPDWKRVNTFSSRSSSVSPHYRYHGAFSQIKHLELTWHMYNFTDEAKKHVARGLLKRWQVDGDDFEASRYVQDVFTIAHEKDESEPGSIITIEDFAQLGIEDN